LKYRTTPDLLISCDVVAPGCLSPARGRQCIGDAEASLWRFKLQLYLVLSVAFSVVYFSLQRFPLFASRTLPLTALDRAIGFHPETIYVYQSVYLLVPLFPFLARTRGELKQYTLGFAWLCGISFLIFAFVPIAGPRPDDETHVAMFRLMTKYDWKVNAMPSLHVGLATYSLLFGYQLSQTDQDLRLLVWIGVAWASLIAYAALATKQHYAADMPPGVVLAWVAHRVASRRKAQE
jgi:membrane-associated phospholipid phosphatase